MLVERIHPAGIAAALTRFLIAAALFALAGASTAQLAYPGKPIRFISPYAPGAGNDILARLVGQRLAENLHQQVIVENRPGGNTIIGTEALAKSPPDGHSIILVSSGHVITPSLFATPYDAIRDFAPVASLASSELVLVVHPSVPANTLQQFIALAKSRPGQLDFASSGTGGPTHLAAELLSIMTGIKMQHIPYKGTALGLSDLVGGHVHLAFSANSSFPYIMSGKLKAIAISGEKRSTQLPQVPTFTESGLPGFDVKFWYGVLAPAGTPKGIVDRLSAEFARIMVMPDVRQKLVSLGADPFVSTPEQFAALLKADLVRFARVIKTARIKVDR